MLLRLLLWLTSIDWTKYRQATCLPNHCFCEALRPGFLRQPIDSLSNLPYFLIGLGIVLYVMISRNKKSSHSAQTHLPRKLLILFGLACLAVGIGSFLYHASFTFLGMELDDDTMYLIGSFMLFFGLAHIFPIKLKNFITYYVLLNLCLEIVIYFFPVIRGFLFGLLILSTLLVDRFAIQRGLLQNRRDHLFWGIGIFAFAYLLWILDDTRLVCYPTSIFQGHALWHVLTAIAMLFIFVYMDSEYPKGFISQNAIMH